MLQSWGWPLLDIIGDKNQKFLIFLHNMGYAYEKLGKIQLANSTYLKCYNFWKQTLGYQHSDTINAVFSVARTQICLGRVSLFFCFIKEIMKKIKTLNFSFFILYVELSLKIGQFEEAILKLSMFPHQILIRLFSYSLQILIRVPKLTQFLNTLKQLIVYKEIEAQKYWGFQRNYQVIEIQAYKHKKNELVEKKKRQIKRAKEPKSWVIFSG